MLAITKTFNLCNIASIIFMPTIQQHQDFLILV